MEQIRKSFNKIWYGGFFGSIIFLLIGILLLIKPVTIISIIVDIIGISVIILGIFGIIRYFKTKNESFNFDLVYGIICIIAGALIISNVKVVASFLPIILGIWMIGNSVIKIQYAMNLKEYSESNWLIVMIISIISLAAGILFVFNPFKGATLITQGLGVALSIYAIMDIVNAIILKKEVKTFTKEVKKVGEKIKDAVYEEVVNESSEEENSIKKTESSKKTTGKKSKTSTTKKTNTKKNSKKTDKK